jgi:5-methylcytosine-specific restriction endonuclease McrA
VCGFANSSSQTLPRLPSSRLGRTRMTQPKITLVGSLRFTEADGLQYSAVLMLRGDYRTAKREVTIWKEALPNAHDWAGLGKFPDRPKNKMRTGGESDSQRAERQAANNAAQKEWQRSADAYHQALHSDPAYRQAALEFIEKQRREPQSMESAGLSLNSRDRTISGWLYRDKTILVESSEPEGLRDKEAEALFVKHFVLRQQRNYESVRREVEALENLERLEGTSREPIPEAVRLFVWQRDSGQCVKCKSRERLEFDHIIPVTAGGSSTERNVQLLCEPCNRSKGSKI